MARTKESAGRQRVTGGKAPRKAVFSTSPGVKKPSKGRKRSVGSYNPQPTPVWQKKITGFFKKIVDHTNPSKERDGGPSGTLCTPHEESSASGQASAAAIDSGSSSSDEN